MFWKIADDFIHCQGKCLKKQIIVSILKSMKGQSMYGLRKTETAMDLMGFTIFITEIP